MIHMIEGDINVIPNLYRRACGGWIAVSPDTAGIKMGVIGETEGEAIARFRASYSEWLKNLDSESPASTH